MRNTLSSLSSRFRLGCSLVYASAQLLKVFSLLLLQATLNDWQNHTSSQSSQQLENLPDPDWDYQDEITDEEVTQIWLSMLEDPDVSANCQHHLSRCLALPPAFKDLKTS